ncbi:MAG: DUF4919 domain-containing protein [Bacteroidales bacterium]
MKKKLLSISLLLLYFLSIGAQIAQKPETKATYETYVNSIKNGNALIDYADFRNSFYESGQVLLALQDADSIKTYRNMVFKQMNDKNFDEAILLLNRCLKNNYTDLEYHFILSFIYHSQGKHTEQKLHRSVSEGLMQTIIESGDGKTPETAFKVNMVSEEYALLRLMNAKILQQSLTNTTPVCDLMTIEKDGKSEKIYFDVTRVMESYKKGRKE